MKESIKFFYFAAVFFCTMQLLLYVLSPFGGIGVIIDMVKKGLYRKELLDCINNHLIYKVLIFGNHFITIIYFFSLFFCLSTLGFTLIGVKKEKKYKYGLYSCLVSCIVLLSGVLLNKFAC